ncbi:MAG: hypothetical protein R3C39_12460 [Dehalococcoidia bacterium]
MPTAEATPTTSEATATLTETAGAVSTPTISIAAGPAASPGDLALILDRRLLVGPLGSMKEALPPPPTEQAYRAPAWSPDRTTIAFIQTNPFTGDWNADFGDDIWLTTVDGERTLLRRHSKLGETLEGLVWSRDGSALLFGVLQWVIEDGIFLRIDTRLVRLDLASGLETTVALGAFAPSLSGDGRRLAYVRAEVAGPTLIVTGAVGSDARTLIEAGTFVRLFCPRLSPDGATVLFSASVLPEVGTALRKTPDGLLARLLGPLWPRSASAHGLPSDLWSVDVATGAVRRLTSLDADDICGAWSPDGHLITAAATGGIYLVSPDSGKVDFVANSAFGALLDVAR